MFEAEGGHHRGRRCGPCRTVDGLAARIDAGGNRERSRGSRDVQRQGSRCNQWHSRPGADTGPPPIGLGAAVLQDGPSGLEVEGGGRNMGWARGLALTEPNAARLSTISAARSVGFPFEVGLSPSRPERLASLERRQYAGADLQWINQSQTGVEPLQYESFLLENN